MKASPENSLILESDHDRIPGFSLLLQKGVVVEVQIGCSVLMFLREQLGLSPEYVETRIQTIMLDGKVVDDPKTAALHPGAVLSLSAAMPGLLGATLRTGSYYAAMRSQISWKGATPTSGSRKGRFVLKLFNLLINEVGPQLLRRGVWVPAEDLAASLNGQREWLRANEVKLFVDGSVADLERIAQTARENGPTFFKIRRPQG
jgi:hypothetical protein